MTWNYRVVKDLYGNVGIHEVYYTDLGEIETWTVEIVEPLSCDVDFEEGELLNNPFLTLGSFCQEFLMYCDAFKRPPLEEYKTKEGTHHLREIQVDIGDVYIQDCWTTTVNRLKLPNCLKIET